MVLRGSHTRETIMTFSIRRREKIILIIYPRLGKTLKIHSQQAQELSKWKIKILKRKVNNKLKGTQIQTVSKATVPINEQMMMMLGQPMRTPIKPTKKNRKTQHSMQLPKRLTFLPSKPLSGQFSKLYRLFLIPSRTSRNVPITVFLQ